MDHLFLSVSQIDVSISVLLGIGFCVGFLSGLLGVGGGWLITPALNMISMPMTFAIGTGLAQMSGTSLFAAFRHRKSGNADIKLGVLIGSIMVGGVHYGKTLLLTLESSGSAESVTRTLYIILLSVMGTTMFWGSMKSLALKKKANASPSGGGMNPRKTQPTNQKTPSSMTWGTHWGPTTRIESANSDVPWTLIIGLGAVGGILSGLLGVGGGFILMPAMIYILRVDTLKAIATSLICVLIASIYGTVIFSISQRVDFQAVGILLIGSLSGSFLGVSSTNHIEPEGLKLVFSGLVIIAAISIGLTQFHYDFIAKSMIFGSAIAITVGSMFLVGRNMIHRNNNNDSEAK